MARREALLRLHQTLLARREHLRKKLAGELADLRDFNNADTTGDSVDVAFETGSDEMTSQLAEFDARELHQIERRSGSLEARDLRGLRRRRRGRQSVRREDSGGAAECPALYDAVHPLPA